MGIVGAIVLFLRALLGDLAAIGVFVLDQPPAMPSSSASQIGPKKTRIHCSVTCYPVANLIFSPRTRYNILSAR